MWVTEIHARLGTGLRVLLIINSTPQRFCGLSELPAGKVGTFPLKISCSDEKGLCQVFSKLRTRIPI